MTESEQQISVSHHATRQLVAHLFRHQAGQIVATLSRVLGIAHLDLIEDVVQDALVKALKTWPYRGIPDNPAGWLMTVARNRALDEVRRRRNLADKSDDIASELARLTSLAKSAPDVAYSTEMRDDLLRMMFACCHPSLPRESQVALILKTLCGFSVDEISAAFLDKRPTVAQRLVRAKQTLREEMTTFDDITNDEMTRRLDAVLDVIYFIFNEGYSAHAGENLVRYELVEESARLGEVLAAHSVGDMPKVHALLALIYMQAARIPGRLDENGELLLLEEQDRSRWDSRCIQAGVAHLDRARFGSDVTEFHLQAGIAACHSLAAAYEDTDWEQIVDYYDRLVELSPSPVVALNRAVAVAALRTPQAGFDELEKIAGLPKMQSYGLYHSTRADLLRRMNRLEEAAVHYKKALALAGSGTHKRFLMRRLKECSS